MTKKDEQEIIELYRQENEAMVKHDITVLNKILAPSMELVHMTGFVQPKMQWIDQIQNEEMKYYSSVEKNVSNIKIDEDHASLIGQNKVKDRIWGGSINTWPPQMKMYFARNNNHWVIVRQVASTY